MSYIIYSDERLLVLDKPSGLLSVPGRGAERQDCLSARIQAELPAALIVHRLDRDTSGVIVMALDPAAQRELSRQFAERTVAKLYAAVVHGCPTDAQGTIDLPLRKDFDHPPRQRIDPLAGKPAQTAWQVVERGEDRSRLAVRPLTGRSHQIRLHLAALGHPVLGDNLYAPPDVRAMASRLQLHSESLTLSHPDDGRRITWIVACPF